MYSFNSKFFAQIFLGGILLVGETYSTPGIYSMTAPTPKRPAQGHLIVECRTKLGKVLRDVAAVRWVLECIFHFFMHKFAHHWLLSTLQRPQLVDRICLILSLWLMLLTWYLLKPRKATCLRGIQSTDMICWRHTADLIRQIITFDHDMLWAHLTWPDLFLMCWTYLIYFLFMMNKWDLFSVHDEQVRFVFCSWWTSEIYFLFMMNKWDLFSVHDEQVRFIFCWWWTSEIYFLFMMNMWDLFSVHDERVWFTFCSWWRSEIYSLFMMNKWDLSSVHDEQARFTFCSWWTSEICFVFMMNKQDFLFIHGEQVRFIFCSWWTSEIYFLFMMNKWDLFSVHDEQVRFIFCSWWTSEIYFLFMMNKWDLFSVHDE